MFYVKLNDDAGTRVNLDNVVAYNAVLTADSEAIEFELAINNTTAILSLNVAYTDADTEDEQVRADLAYLDSILEVKQPPVATDQS